MAIVSSSSLPEGLLGEIGIDDHHLPYRIDRWDDGKSVAEHLADIDDLIVARAIYEAACKRWLARPAHHTTPRGPRHRGQPGDQSELIAFGSAVSERAVRAGLPLRLVAPWRSNRTAR